MLTRTKNRITKIPVQGNSVKCPSGAMEFQLDSPGLWLRGDHALELFDELKQFREKVLIPKGIDKYPDSVEVVLEIIAEDVKVKWESGMERMWD